jgi:hypothetical protein
MSMELDTQSFVNRAAGVCDSRGEMVLQESQQTASDDDCKVTKTQLLRFFETKFEMADRDHDGQLSVSELSRFLRYVTHPDLRSLHAWDRYGQPAK